MMSSYDFLNIAVGAGFLILVGFAAYTLFSLSATLKELTSILRRVDDITKDVEDLKNLIKKGGMYLTNILLKKGGDKHGKSSNR